MQDNVSREMELMGGLTIISIVAKSAETDEEKLAYSRSPGLRISDGDALVARVPQVEMVLPQNEIGWRGVSGAGRRSGGQPIAIGPDHLTTYNYTVSLGSPISLEQHQRRERVCLIGSDIATRLFGSEKAALGGTVNTMERLSLRVVGIIETKNRYDSRARQVLFPFSVYESTVGSASGRTGTIKVKVKRIGDIAPAQQAIEATLRDLHRGVNDFSVETNVEKLKDMEATSLGIRVVLAAVAIISLLVGSISITNTMFGTIGDRIREIGLRKALGARRADVFTQFLIESVLLSAVGGVPGILLGAAFTMFPRGTFPFEPDLTVLDYTITSLFIILAGVTSGVFPALKAARMEPVDALRY
jgi:putative ABC transport system permease protein